jgi:cytochrome c oxidase cbb3-type subunit IV
MSKIIKQYADQIAGIEWYPVASLIIFTLFFAGVLLYVKRLPKEQVSELSIMPLDLSQETK